MNTRSAIHACRRRLLLLLFTLGAATVSPAPALALEAASSPPEGPWLDAATLRMEPWIAAVYLWGTPSPALRLVVEDPRQGAAPAYVTAWKIHWDNFRSTPAAEDLPADLLQLGLAALLLERLPDSHPYYAQPDSTPELLQGLRKNDPIQERARLRKQAEDQFAAARRHPQASPAQRAQAAALAAWQAYHHEQAADAAALAAETLQHAGADSPEHLAALVLQAAGKGGQAKPELWNSLSRHPAAQAHPRWRLLMFDVLTRALSHMPTPGQILHDPLLPASERAWLVAQLAQRASSSSAPAQVEDQLIVFEALIDARADAWSTWDMFHSKADLTPFQRAWLGLLRGRMLQESNPAGALEAWLHTAEMFPKERPAEMALSSFLHLIDSAAASAPEEQLLHASRVLCDLYPHLPQAQTARWRLRMLDHRFQETVGARQWNQALPLALERFQLAQKDDPALPASLPQRLDLVRIHFLLNQTGPAQAILDPILSDADLQKNPAVQFWQAELLFTRRAPEALAAADAIYQNLIQLRSERDALWWNSWKRTLQIREINGKLTATIPALVRQLRAKDIALGGEDVRSELERLEQKYKPKDKPKASP